MDEAWSLITVWSCSGYFMRNWRSLKLRYTSTLFTRSSMSTRTSLTSGITICVGHVVKHFYKHIMNAREKPARDDNGRKISLKSRSGLTEDNVRTLPWYYKEAILSNTGV